MAGVTRHIKAYLGFYLVAIFMLTNGSFFGWLLRGAPLNMWRQLIWICGLAVCYRLVPRINVRQLRHIFKVEGVLAFGVLLLSLVTVWQYDFNYLRIVYAYWMYFAGLPFICLPFLVAKTRYISPKAFYGIFTYLGLFLSIGLIADYASGGYFTERFLINNTEGLDGLLDDGRYCFLSEAPTTFGVYYAFCMFCGCMRMTMAKTFLSKLYFLAICMSFMVGAWFTGSRQIVLVLGMMFVGGNLFYLIKGKGIKAHLIVGGILVACFAPSLVSSVLMEEKSYSNRYSESSLKEDTRSRAWKRGFNETIADDITVALIGKAVALSQGQKAMPNEIVGSHYENTFFGRLSECGLIGLILLCYPVYYIVRRLGKWDLFQTLVMLFLISYLTTCFVSPNGQHPTTQTVLFVVLGMFMCRDYFDIEAAPIRRCLTRGGR